MNDKHLANSYRRIFRIVTSDMSNWKTKIVVCVDSDDMKGTDDSARIARAVRRMGRIKRAIEFMVGRGEFVKLLDNADGTGKTLVYRNAGYYVNIGA
jgi:hypothetical protein